jgi:amino acid transporter
MHPLTPLRWMSYMLIALGLINWRYQSAEPEAFNNSIVIIAIGGLQLAGTFLPQTAALFTRPPLKFIAWIISVGAVIFAVIN